MAARPVRAEVDLAAVRHNAAVLAGLAQPAALCAVVKAAAYGHGAVPVARAALEAGAAWLAVAMVEEGAELRTAGIGAPVLLLSEPPASAMADVAGLGLVPTLYTHAGVEAAAKAVAASGVDAPLPVHVKVDTGMHRVGADPAEAVAVAVAVDERPELELQGLWTHFAVADQPDHPFTAGQLDRFGSVVADLGRLGVRPPLVHCCNSAGLLTTAGARGDLVRCGIALYGVAPSAALAGRAGLRGPNAEDSLRPALSLRAEVSYVRRVAAGEGLSYGLRYRLDRPSTVAIVPLGYADGVPWRLAETGGEVLLGGRRRPIAGAVTMDQVLVDCGDASVAPGDEVVLLGAQGDDRIDAWEWAGKLGTIAYEVLCGIGARVPRVYV